MNEKKQKIEEKIRVLRGMCLQFKRVGDYEEYEKCRWALTLMRRSKFSLLWREAV